MMQWNRVRASSNVVGLLFGSLGGILLFYSLTLKSSNYRLVETADHQVAICLNNRKIATGFGGPLGISDEPCPEGIGPSISPVTEAEKPTFVPWGLRLIVAGFLLQLPAGGCGTLTKTSYS
jgi:hypothetical protein